MMPVLQTADGSWAAVSLNHGCRIEVVSIIVMDSVVCIVMVVCMVMVVVAVLELVVCLFAHVFCYLWMYRLVYYWL